MAGFLDKAGCYELLSGIVVADPNRKALPDFEPPQMPFEEKGRYGQRRRFTCVTANDARFLSDATGDGILSNVYPDVAHGPLLFVARAGWARLHNAGWLELAAG